MLSQSRFLDELVRTEILPQGEDTILGFRLGDPGGNLLLGHRPSVTREEQPLTRMAASATTGQSGVDVEGYRDYRGVRVLGAWLWDLELQIGSLGAVKDERDQAVVDKTLAKLTEDAAKGVNVMPAIMDAVQAYATVGEMTDALTGVYGRYVEPIRF